MSEDCAMASNAKSRVSLAIVPDIVCRFELADVLLAPIVGPGVTINQVSLAISASGFSDTSDSGIPRKEVLSEDISRKGEQMLTV